MAYYRKEEGVTGKDNPELLRKLINYMSWQSEGPFWYEYPEVSFTTRAEIWEMALKHNYGDIHPDVWECHVGKFFDDEMKKILEKQGIEYSITIPAELKDKFTSPYSYIPSFFDERERMILTAIKDNHTLKMIYFSFENGTGQLSSECITPIKMIYTHHYWTLVGIDEKRETKEYVIPRILEVKTS